MRQTSDRHVSAAMPLITPAACLRESRLSERAADLVAGTRDRIRAILAGEDRRLLVVVGPCSIHDPVAAEDYGHRLGALRQELSERLEIVMRVYFEKPRTSIGWKGLINDPHLDGSYDINHGLRLARGLLLRLAEEGMPAATELLDPIIPQYLADLVSWTAIGARTTESQTHREMASGLSMPVGFKNSTDGSLDAAVNAMLAARHPHRFLGITHDGLAAIVTTTGNPDGHLVLRGGRGGPNYDPASVVRAAGELERAGVCPRLMIDCSHDNSGKDHARQPQVLAEVARQVREGGSPICGVMIESHLEAGRQALGKDPRQLVYGRSITDACVDFPATATMLHALAEAVDAGCRHASTT